jgi:hypothetical protein
MAFFWPAHCAPRRDFPQKSPKRFANTPQNVRRADKNRIHTPENHPMQLKWLSSLLGEKKSGARDDRAALRSGASALSAHSQPLSTIYPPDDRGLPLRSIEDLLKGNETIIGRLKLHAAASPTQYEVRYLTPIKNLASLINTLPGTASSMFAGEGGLLRACLELGFLSFQASDGRIFTGADSVEVRHKLEPRWRYICFIAGLLYPLGLPLTRMVVTTKSGESWPKHKHDITEWADGLQAQGIHAERVYITWSDERQLSAQEMMGPSPFSASILHKIAGPENLGWLEEGSPNLTRTLFEVVGGSETSSKIAQDVVATMWKKVLSREETRRPETYGRMSVGTHLTPYLVGAMRTLVEDGVWKINEGPLLADGTGLYLTWPDAGKDLVAQGAREGRDGWPSSVSTLAELLKQDGVFDISHESDMGMTEVVDRQGEIRQAYKLKKPHAVVEDFDSSAYIAVTPKTLAGVLERDPLASAESKVQSKKTAPPKIDPVLDTTPAPVAAQEEPALVFDTESEDDEDIPDEGLEPQDVGEVIAATAQVRSATPAQKSAPVESAVSAAVQRTPEDASGKLKEAPEVKFSDLVPEEIRKELKSTLTLELLGKLIKAWRERGEQNTAMRMTDQGAAFSVDYLGTLIRNIPDWVNDVALAGLVYTPADRPGLKVQKVAIPEGTKPKDAIVISRYGCRKLGL